MRWIFPLTACLALVAATGCQTTDPDLKPHGTMNLSHRAVNEAMIESYDLAEIDNATIRQHTIYPYHFVQYGAALNTLGKREVYVLAHHYQKYPGPVNVHQGNETDALYQQRVQAVKDAMIAAGVSAGQINIADEMPGGDGLSSNEVTIVLKHMHDKLSGASAPATAYTSPQQGAANNAATASQSANTAAPMTANP